MVAITPLITHPQTIHEWPECLGLPLDLIPATVRRDVPDRAFPLLCPVLHPVDRLQAG